MNLRKSNRKQESPTLVQLRRKKVVLIHSKVKKRKYKGDLQEKVESVEASGGDKQREEG